MNPKPEVRPSLRLADTPEHDTPPLSGSIPTGSRLLDLLESVPTPEVRIGHVEGIILSDHAHPNRDALVQLWANSVVEAVGGTDDLSQAYRLKLQKHIDRINGATFKSDAAQILNALSHACCSQERLAYHIETCVEENTFGMSSAAIFDGGLCSLAGALPNAQTTLLFLSSCPGPLEFDQFESASSGITAAQAEQLHLEYHGLSKAAQNEFLGQILGVDTMRMAFLMRVGGTIPPLLNGFLPADRPNTTADLPGAHRIGKLIADKFVRKAENQDILSAVRALVRANYEDALRPQSDHPEVRFGYRLATFGSDFQGITKAVQYGNSLPITPEAWLEGTEKTKSEAVYLTRAEEWRNVRANVTPELLDALYLGRPLGFGTYISTYEAVLDPNYLQGNPTYAEMPNGAELALCTLKPGARIDARRVTDTLIEVCDDIVNSNPAAEASVAPLRGILDEGAKMIDLETDLRISKQQEEIIARILSGLKVSINGQLFERYTQNAFDVGIGFRTSLCVRGAHFNKLPNGTAFEQYMRRMSAMHDLVTEMFVAATAQEKCHDRHGDNVAHRDYFVVGHYDGGARARTQPTELELVSMMDLLVNAGANSVRNGYGFPSSLKHTLTRTEQRIEDGLETADTSELRRTQRTVVSWGDFMKDLEPQDYIMAALAIAKSGQVNSTILKTLLSRGAQIALSNVPILKRFAKRELARREVYYADNPNPRRQQAGGTDQQTEQPKAQPTARPPLLRVQISDSNLKPTLLGRVVAAAATVAEIVYLRGKKFEEAPAADIADAAVTIEEAAELRAA